MFSCIGFKGAKMTIKELKVMIYLTLLVMVTFALLDEFKYKKAWCVYQNCLNSVSDPNGTGLDLEDFTKCHNEGSNKL